MYQRLTVTNKEAYVIGCKYNILYNDKVFTYDEHFNDYIVFKEWTVYVVEKMKWLKEEI